MQFLFESAVASMLKYKQVTKAVSVIYTPLPSSPLRTDGNNIPKLVSKDIISDPDRLNTLIVRYESLHEFLENKGFLYSIYKNTKFENDIPGFNIYKSNLRKYPKNLHDVPVDSFNPQHIGASYLIECDNGTRGFFAISASQINDTSSKREWELYYGRPGETVIYTHLKALKNLYKNHGVDFSLY